MGRLLGVLELDVERVRSGEATLAEFCKHYGGLPASQNASDNVSAEAKIAIQIAALLSEKIRDLRPGIAFDVMVNSVNSYYHVRLVTDAEQATRNDLVHNPQFETGDIGWEMPEVLKLGDASSGSFIRADLVDVHGNVMRPGDESAPDCLEQRLAAALDAFNDHEHLGKTEAMRKALEAAG